MCMCMSIDDGPRWLTRYLGMSLCGEVAKFSHRMRLPQLPAILNEALGTAVNNQLSVAHVRFKLCAYERDP